MYSQGMGMYCYVKDSTKLAHFSRFQITRHYLECHIFLFLTIKISDYLNNITISFAIAETFHIWKIIRKLTMKSSFSSNFIIYDYIVAKLNLSFPGMFEKHLAPVSLERSSF